MNISTGVACGLPVGSSVGTIVGPLENINVDCKQWEMGFMVRGRMVLGAAVCPVEEAWSPVKTKLALRLAATEPVISQFPRFTLAWENVLVHDARCGGVFHLNGQQRLGPSYFNQSWRIGTISLAVINIAPISASAS